VAARISPSTVCATSIPFTSCFRVRATVATNTLDAPARSKTRAHSETVVPVVKTSSISRTSRPAISCGRETTKPRGCFRGAGAA